MGLHVLAVRQQQTERLGCGSYQTGCPYQGQSAADTCLLALRSYLDVALVDLLGKIGKNFDGQIPRLFFDESLQSAQAH